ncbi:MAG: GntR family transcriptional regulator [Syntrophaceae bacterium]|nr:GntR family transcriptional regulator [Syntrophaceae bacterium]
MRLQKKDLKKDYNKLIERLENMVLGGRFKPRERLIELTLAEELGVSRFWIRDALKILETKGLIQVIPYKGAMVCDLNEREVEEIFEVRIELESLAIRKAAENIQKSDINSLEQMAARFEESVSCGDLGEMISADTSFHGYIIALGNNETLIQMITQLKARCHILRFHAWSSPEIVQRIQKEHRLFIKGLENKDFKLLDELSGKHICYSKDFYLMRLKVKRGKTAVLNA